MEQSNLKILHIIASVDLRDGGPIQAILQTINNLPPNQTLEIVSLDEPDAKWVAEFPTKVHAVGPTFLKYGYTPKLAKWIVENAERFDAAVIHGLWNHASLGGAQGCRKANLPYVIFSHGMMDPWFKKTYPLKHALKQLFWLLQGRVLRDASAVLFTCEQEKKLAVGAFWGYNYTSKIVAFGAPDVLQLDLSEGDQFKNIVPHLNDKPYLLYISRIHKKKGCDVLLEGFAKAIKNSELQLVMAGPCHDDLVDKLKLLAEKLDIAERVHWVGMIKGAAKAAAFRGAEAFVLISHQENFGIAVAEALAYAKPVLISNQINIWREIEAGGAGLVADDTVDGAIEILGQWEVLTKDEKKSMCLAARNVYENNFTTDAATRDLTSALQNAIRANKSNNN